MVGKSEVIQPHFNCLFAEALVTVAAGLALGTFLDVAGRCIAQQVNP
jgi:hypothetical protein